MSKEKKFMVIKSRTATGLFSNFIHTLQYLYKSKLEDKIPIIHWEKGLYSKSGSFDFTKNIYSEGEENIWEYYFEPVSDYDVRDMKEGTQVVYKYKKNRKNKGRINSEPEWCWHSSWTPPLVKKGGKFKLPINPTGIFDPSQEGRDFINGLISEYIRLKPDILKEVDDFYDVNMKGHKVVGAHMRIADDKILNSKECPSREVAIDMFVNNIKQYIKKYGADRILVAADIVQAVDALKNEFGDQVIYTDCFRSSDGSVSCCKHDKLDDANAFKKDKVLPGTLAAGPQQGREAVIDCYVLSKCDFLFKSFSNLSAVSTFINPKMGYKTLPDLWDRRV